MSGRNDSKIERNRYCYGFLILVWIALGLYSRSSLLMPHFFQVFGGDVLWSGMVYFVLAFCFKKMKFKYLVMITLTFSYIIEFSQLLSFPWLIYARTTMLRYLLGQGFVWSDLLCYTIGVGLSFVADYTLCTKRR